MTVKINGHYGSTPPACPFEVSSSFESTKEFGNLTVTW